MASRAQAANNASAHSKRASFAVSDNDSVISAPLKTSSRNQRLQSIRLHAFEHDFDIVNLIGALTEETIGGPGNTGEGIGPSGRANVFDPQPYIKAFETAVNQLLPLRQKVFNKASEHEATVHAAEREYNAKLQELRDNFEAVSTSFSSLESRISEIGRTAIRIGDQLESIDKGKQRAIDAHDIIQYYFDFQRGDSTNLEHIRKEEGREGRAKVALIARRLAAVAKEVESMDKGEETRQAVEKYCERFENDMLKLFDRYYRKSDPKGMAHCAKVLLDFNGGQSCIQMYVNQHDFFISRDRISDGSSLIDTQILEALPDPNSAAPREEPRLTSMFAEVRGTVAEEAQITQAVFPNPALVMQVFLQRVFAQVIQMYIERLITNASSSSTLAFLRVLHLAHQSTSALVKDLKGIDLFKTAALRIDSADSSRVPANSDASDGPAGLANLSMIGTMLDQVFEELFMPYMEGNRYIEKETKSLNELYASYLLRFMNWHQTKSATKQNKTVFDRMVNQLTNATAASQTGTQSNVNTSPLLGSDTGSMTMGLKALLKIGNVTSLGQHGSPSQALPTHSGERRASNDRDAVAMQNKEDGELDINVAERMLKWHAEAIGRMVDLSAVADVPKNAFTLLRTLSDSYARAYVEMALDTTLMTVIASTEVKVASEPDLSSLEIVYKTDIIMSLWQRYISVALMPLAGPSLTTRREMGIFTNHVMVRIEGKINELVQRLTDSALSWLSILLNRQKKTDFKPKNDDLALSTMNTEACLACRDFCHRVKIAADAHLSGKNKENFLSEIGLGLHGLLLEHLKRFPVSSTGGLMLTRDLAIYQEAVLEFDVNPLTERFDMIRQLGNVFVVRPEIIKAYMSESYLSKIEGRLLRPFLVQRADYGDYSRKFWDDVCGESSSNQANGTSNR